MKWLLFIFLSLPFGLASDIRQQLERQEVLGTGEPIKAKGAYTNEIDANGGLISFGAEKEGFDYRIINVAGPNAQVFKDYVYWLDKLPFFGSQNRKKFLRKLLHGMFNLKGKKSYRISESVKDIDGVERNFDVSEFEGKNYKEMGVTELWNNFTKWVDKTNNSPFSFIKKDTLKQIIKGKFINHGRNDVIYLMEGWFKSWVPHFGTPQKYIGEISPARHVDFRYYGHPRGWEVNFAKQDSYGDFRGMVDWFKKEMDQLEPQKDLPENMDYTQYQAPGHQRVVFPLKKFPKTKNGEMSPKEETYLEKMAEFFRLAQSLIVVRGLRGKTGIGTSKWKEVHDDEKIKSLVTYKGVLRLEKGRWGEKTMGVELRAGTKDDELASNIIKSLTERVATDNWRGLKKISDWQLVHPALLELESYNPVSYAFAIKQLVDNTNVSALDAFTFLKVVNKLKNEKGRTFKLSFMLFMWNWADAPFLTKQKKAFLADLSKTTIENIATKFHHLDFDKLKEIVSDWARASKLDVDLLNTLMPPMKKIEEKDILVENSGEVDVNDIDLGIEFSTRFHLDPITIRQRLGKENKLQWMETRVDLTLKERRKVIMDLAKEMSKNLSGGAPEFEKVGGAHGHGLGIAVVFRDSKDREWKIEWDGINREYNENGRIVPGSPHGGHMEVVTPKFVPTATELNAVMQSFVNRGHYPKHNRGGGHHNIDLKPFIGNPNALARFIAYTHRYLPLISTMYQSLERRKSSLPLEMNEEFIQKLLTQDWTEEELKTELYKNGYFNPQSDRKTRYIFLDLSAYFQDVIPPEYVTKDYDFKSPAEIPHKQFRVNPKIRKMEFRLFNAPMSAKEIGGSIKMVRALLNKALNEDDMPEEELKLKNPLEIIKDPESAHEDLKVMAEELHLPFSEYEFQLNKSITAGKQIIKKKFFHFEEPLKLDTEHGWLLLLLQEQKQKRFLLKIMNGTKKNYHLKMKTLLDMRRGKKKQKKLIQKELFTKLLS